MREGWCNGQPAFATYEPGHAGQFTASGLQIPEIADLGDQLRIQAIVSFRDGNLALRCGLASKIA